MNSSKNKTALKLLSVILAAIFVFSMIPVQVFAEMGGDDEVEAVQAPETSTAAPSETESETKATEEPTESTTAEPTTTEKAEEPSSSEAESTSETEKATEKTPDKGETTTSPSKGPRKGPGDPGDSSYVLTVKDGIGHEVVGATVKFDGETFTTDGDGKVTITGSDLSAIYVDISKTGYKEEKNLLLEISGGAFSATLYKEVAFSAEVQGELPDSGYIDYSEFTASLSDGSVTLSKSGNRISATVLEGKIYTLTVNPDNSARFETYSAKLSDVTSPIQLKLKKYDVTLNGVKKDTYKYGQEAEITLEDKTDAGFDIDKVTMNGNECDYTGNKVKFTVTETTAIVVSYTFTVTLNVGENGSISYDGKTQGPGSVDVKKNKDNSFEYTASADNGYYVKSCTVNKNGTTSSYVNESDDYSVTSKSGSVGTKSTITVSFAEKIYDLKVTINNSAKKLGSATVADTKEAANSVSVARNNEKAEKTLKIGAAYLSGSSYVVNLKVEALDDHYDLKVGEDVLAKNDTHSVTMSGDSTVSFTLVPKEYKLNFVDPFVSKSTYAENALDEVTFTYEEGDMTLPAPTKAPDGFTFLGWSDAPTDKPMSTTGGIKTSTTGEALGADKTLYANYVIDNSKIGVQAKSFTNYINKDNTLSFALSEGSSLTTNEDFFGNDVELALTDFDGVEYTVNNATKTSGDGEPSAYKVTAENGSTKNVTVEAQIDYKLKIGEEEKTYSFVNDTATNVIPLRFDTVDPSISTNSSTSKVEASDEDTGIALVQYTDFNVSGDYSSVSDTAFEEGSVGAILKAVANGKITDDANATIVKLKDYLRGDSVTWTTLATAAGSYDTDTEKGHIKVFRAVDKAGNDAYSVFDNTKPFIDDVTWKYSAGDNKEKNNTTDIYTNSDFEVKATVKDRKLVFDGTYTGATLTVYDAADDSKSVTFASTESVEKFSLFYDKWESTFIVDVSKLESLGLTNKELKFRIDAKDQTENTAEPYVFGGTVIIDKTDPEIDVSYTYSSLNDSEPGKRSAGKDFDSIYSSGEVTALFTVTDDYFTIYGGKQDYSDLVLTDNGEAVTGIEWTKSKTGATATVTIDSEGAHELELKAVSEPGNKASYKSNTIVIDNTKPGIVIDIAPATAEGASYYAEEENLRFVKDEDTSAYNVTVTITDTYFDPYLSDENHSSEASAKIELVNADGNTLIKDVTSDATWGDPTIEGRSASFTVDDLASFKVKVTAKDQVGNEKAEFSSDTLIRDGVAPVLDTLTIEPANEGTGLTTDNENLNAANGKILLTATVLDQGDTQSGVKALTLNLTDSSGTETIEMTKDADKSTRQVAVFTTVIPAGELAEWLKEANFVFTDNVGNTADRLISEDVDLDDLVKSGIIIIDLTAPEITSTQNYAADNLYKTGEEYWLKKDQSYSVTVTEPNPEICSGLKSVTIRVEGAATKSNTYTYDTRESEKVYTYGYGDFDEGLNTITVNAVDQAGNPAEQQVYKVYKDIKEPTLSVSSTSAEGGTADANVLWTDTVTGKLWLKNNAAFNVTVTDPDVYSGLHSVELTLNGKSYGKTYGNGTKNQKFEKNIAYVDFKPGDNTITVSAVDNVGYELETATFTVYKDNQEPIIEVNGIDKNAGDGTVTYKDEASGQLWLKDGATLDLAISDHARDGLDDSTSSLLNTVVVTVTGSKDSKETKFENINEIDLVNRSDIAEYLSYDKLYSGKNDVTITAVDNAGNEADVKTFTVYKDEEPPIVTTSQDNQSGGAHDTSDLYLVTGKSEYWLIKDADYDISVIDKAPSSGFASMSILLNGGSANEKEYAVGYGTASNVDSDNVFTTAIPYDDFVEGSNTIVITAVDNTGNELLNSAGEAVTYTVWKDVTPPSHTTSENNSTDEFGATHDIDDLYKASKVDNSFWLKVNQNYDIDLTDIIDESTATSGLDKVTVTVNGDIALQEKYSKDFANGSKTSTYHTEIEYEDLEPGKNTITVYAVDNVGNEMNGGSTVTYTVYTDKAEPTVETSQDNQKDKEGNSLFDKSVLYFDTKTNSYWLRKDKSYKITVSDADPTSGLDKITIKVNNDSALQEKYSKDYADGTIEPLYTTAIEYDDLKPGKNTITIYAVDNVGNELNGGEEVKYIVWKDNVDPALNGIKISNASGSDGGSRLSFGNFYNEDIGVKLLMLDDSYSSGIDSVSLKYVYTNADKSEASKSYKAEDTKLSDEVLVEEYAIKTDDGIPFNRNFPIKYIDQTEGYFVVEIIDNVGNSYTYSEEKADAPKDSNITINHLMFEQAKLKISFTLSDAAYNCECGKAWYQQAKDADLTVKVSETAEKKSGIRSVEILLNGKKMNNPGGKFTSEKTNVETFENNIAASKWREGENVVTVNTIDNAGNKSSKETKFYIDTKKPAVTSFDFFGTNGGKNNDQKNQKAVTPKKTSYGYFFDRDTKVKVSVSDANPSSGIKTIYFLAVPAVSDSSKLDTSKVIVQKCNSAESGATTNSATFTVKAGFKGEIYAYVEDNVGNNSLKGDVSSHSNWVKPQELDVILETNAMHVAAGKHIKVELVSTPVSKDSNGHPLFNKDATIRVTIDDKYAGIKEANVEIKAKNGSTSDKVTISKDGKISGGWSASSRDKNLVTEITRTYNVSFNSNDIQVFVNMTDNSGNTSNNSKDDFIFSIDKDAPVISVSFDKAASDDDPRYEGYFKTDRVMTVTVKERNFDQNLINVIVNKNDSTYPSEGGRGNVNVGSFSGGSVETINGAEVKVYTLRYTFSSDGHYTLTVNGSDMATNKTEDSQVDYGSAANKAVAKKFTIDKTAPVVNVSRDPGGETSNQEIHVTVSITEHNYDLDNSGLYSITFVYTDPTGSGKHCVAPAPSIGRSGDTYTYTYTFDRELEGKWTFESVVVTDMAGNVTTNSNTDSFIVDVTSPKVTITYTGLKSENGTVKNAEKALNGTALSGSGIEITVLIEDVTLPDKATLGSMLHVSRSARSAWLALNKNDHYLDVLKEPETRLKHENNKATWTITIPETEAYDDIYTISVSDVKDIAGNFAVAEKTGQETKKQADIDPTFSVNRYGSTFMLDDGTKDFVGKYYNNKEEDIRIIQIDAAPIESKSTTVFVDENGISSKLQSDDFVSSGGNSTSGEGYGWYQCEYTLYASRFESEGEYGVSFTSSDGGKNKISSINPKFTDDYSEKMAEFTQKSNATDLFYRTDVEGEKDKPVNYPDKATTNIAFVIDKTAPTAELSIKDGAGFKQGDNGDYTYEKSNVFATSADLEVNVYDNFAVESFEVLDKGGNTVGEKNSDTITLKADVTACEELKLVAVDKAGNKLLVKDENADDSQLHEPLYKIKVTNKPVRMYFLMVWPPILTALLIVLAFVIIFIIRKRKQGED